ENRSQTFESIVTVTAQHRRMLDQVLDILEIKPDYDMDIVKERESLTQITTQAVSDLEAILQDTHQDIVLDHGDTTTTFAATLAAFYHEIAIGHVEAGLRTWNKYSPFPEEMNRQLTGIMADLHFSPTEKAKQNLMNENKAPDTIYV